ncbi:MAG TPA: hypothetical protein VHU82_06605 [Vicinamibacterales bacterium]|jgi:hypothetical protein|nr:hypothetical protein [Vicinamibacterales bacterium]
MLNCLRHIAVAVVVLFFVVAPAEAQTLPGPRRVFVDIIQYPDWDDTRIEKFPGATWGTGFAFGVDGAKSGIELDVGLPQWHVKNLGPYVSEYNGPSFEYEQHGHVYESSSTERRRSVDLMVLHRSNIPLNRRITLTWLAGAGIVYRPVQDASMTKEVLPGGQRIEVAAYQRASSRDYMAATTRLDLELRIAPHVSVVPRVGVTAFPSLLDDSGLAPSGLTARPEVAVRWAF